MTSPADLKTLDAGRAVDASAGVIFDLTALLGDRPPSDPLVVSDLIDAARRLRAAQERIGDLHACAIYVGGDVDRLDPTDLRTLRTAGVATLAGAVTADLVDTLTQRFNRALLSVIG